MTRSAPLPPVCPICQPAAFDGSLDLVPAAQFCGQHKGHVLRWVFERAGVRLERDAARVARLTFSARSNPQARTCSGGIISHSTAPATL